MLWMEVQKLLNKQKMSVYRLSKLTGIPLNTLYSYKNQGAEPSFRNMAKIADALNVGLDEFRGGNEDE